MSLFWLRSACSMVTKRPFYVRPNVRFIPCMRSTGAIRRSSSVNHRGDLGHRPEAAALRRAATASSECRSAGGPVHGVKRPAWWLETAPNDKTAPKDVQRDASPQSTRSCVELSGSQRKLNSVNPDTQRRVLTAIDFDACLSALSCLPHGPRGSARAAPCDHPAIAAAPAPIWIKSSSRPPSFSD
jgi:hypothetical protein